MAPRARTMTWRERLLEIVLLGGAASTAGCTSSQGGGCCNANSDPCCISTYCGAPMTDACRCKLDGGVWSYPDCNPADTGTFHPDSGLPHDADASDALSHDGTDVEVGADGESDAHD